MKVTQKDLDIIHRFMDEDLSTKEYRKLNQRLETDASFSRAFARTVSMGRLLSYHARSEEHPADISRSIEKILTSSETSGRCFTETVKKRLDRRTAAKQTLRPAVFSARRILSAAALVAVAFVAGLVLQHSRTPEPEFLVRSRNAKNIDDLRRLHPLLDKAYQEQKTVCSQANPVRLSTLGLSEAIAAYAREDRQCDDLRFVLENFSKQSGTASGHTPWIRTANAKLQESGADRLGTDYMEAHSLARSGQYAQREKKLKTSAATAHARGLNSLSRQLKFELGYRTFYERGLARMGRHLLEQMDTSSSFGRYYALRLSPQIEQAALQEKRFEENLDFEKPRKEAGSWHIKMTPGGRQIRQTKITRKIAGLLLTGKTYNRPFILSYAVRILDFRINPTPAVGILLFKKTPKKEYCIYQNVNFELLNQKEVESARSMIRDKWSFRYAMKAIPMDNGFWKYVISDLDINDTARKPITWIEKPTYAKKIQPKLRGPISVGVMTKNCACEFTDLQLEFIDE